MQRTAALVSSLATIGLVALASSACSAAVWQGVAEGMAAASSPVGAATSSKFMIFGGPGHDTYLGCLNCGTYATDSVFNQFGQNGSKYSATSIFNQYNQFGSKFSAYSPCNRYASDPPVIVDEAGRYYGRLTIKTIGDRPPTAELRAWIVGVCG